MGAMYMDSTPEPYISLIVEIKEMYEGDIEFTEAPVDSTSDVLCNLFISSVDNNGGSEFGFFLFYSYCTSTLMDLIVDGEQIDDPPQRLITALENYANRDR